jgi:hypothetical protein
LLDTVFLLLRQISVSMFLGDPGKDEACELLRDKLVLPPAMKRLAANCEWAACSRSTLLWDLQCPAPEKLMAECSLVDAREDRVSLAYSEFGNTPDLADRLRQAKDIMDEFTTGMVRSEDHQVMLMQAERVVSSYFPVLQAVGAHRASNVMESSLEYGASCSSSAEMTKLVVDCVALLQQRYQQKHQQQQQQQQQQHNHQLLEKQLRNLRVRLAPNLKRIFRVTQPVTCTVSDPRAAGFESSTFTLFIRSDCIPAAAALEVLEELVYALGLPLDLAESSGPVNVDPNLFFVNRSNQGNWVSLLTLDETDEYEEECDTATVNAIKERLSADDDALRRRIQATELSEEDQRSVRVKKKAPSVEGEM